MPRKAIRKFDYSAFTASRWYDEKITMSYIDMIGSNAQETALMRNENNDCVVRALKVALGVSYRVAWALCRISAKRAFGQGVMWHKWDYGRIGLEKVEGVLGNTRRQVLDGPLATSGVPMVVIVRTPKALGGGAHAVAIKDGKLADWRKFSPMLRREVIAVLRVKEGHRAEDWSTL